MTSRASKALWLMRSFKGLPYDLAHILVLSSSITDLIRAVYALYDHYVAYLRTIRREEFTNLYKNISALFRAKIHR